LGYLQNIQAPPEDQSEIATTGAIDYVELARRYLIAGQVPEGFLALPGSWGYTIDYPTAKSGSGSWIQEAGKLAAICGQYLYCNASGLVVSRPFSLVPVPDLSIQIGEEDAEWDDSQEEAAPPQFVRVTASGKALPPPPDPGTAGLPRRESIYGNLNGISPGLVGFGEVAAQRIYPQQRVSLPGGAFKITERIEQLVRGATISPKYPPPLSSLRTVRDSTSSRYYDAQSRLYKEVELIEQPAIAIDPDETTNKTLMIVTSRRTTTYGFGSGNEVLNLEIEEEAARRVIWDQAGKTSQYPESIGGSTLGDNRWTTEIRSRDKTDWYKGGDGTWWQRKTIMKCRADLQPEGVAGEEDAYLLMGDYRASLTDRSDPPRIQVYGADSIGAEDKQFAGEARFTHPGGAVDREFRIFESLDTPAVADGQCANYAKAIGAILWGRNQGFTLQLGLQKLLAIDYPLACLEAIEPPPEDWLAPPNRPSKVHRILIDALTWSHSTDRAVAEALGIWLGTGSIAGQTPPPPYLIPNQVLLPLPPIQLTAVVEDEDMAIFGAIATPTSACSSTQPMPGPRWTKWFSPLAARPYNINIDIAYGVQLPWAYYRATAAGTGYALGDRLWFRRAASGVDEWFNQDTNQVLASAPPETSLGSGQFIQVIRWNSEPNSSNFTNGEWVADIKAGPTGRARIIADIEWRWFGIRAPNPSQLNFYVSPTRPIWDGVWFTIDSPAGTSEGDGQQWILRGF
jgi:hypothetical protein